MEKYRHFSLFIILISTPDFPPFLLYVRWNSGVTFVRRCFRDDNKGTLDICMKVVMNNQCLTKCQRDLYVNNVFDMFLIGVILVL